MSGKTASINDNNNENSSLLDKLKLKLGRMLGRKDKKCPLDLTLKTEAPNFKAQRKSFRVSVDNMHIVCRTPRVKCKVSDVSADGIGFLSSKEFKIGSIVEAVLLWSGKPILKKLKIKVMRRHKNIVGCSFQELTKNQDKIVSKIVLAAQKRAIKPGAGQKIELKTEEELTKAASQNKTDYEKHKKNKTPIKL